MLVGAHMTGKVITIDADRPVADATRLLLQHRIRQLPVLRNGQLVGIIAHRDLRAARLGRKRVAALMTAKPFVIGPDASIDEAARTMRTYKVGGLPVVEGKRLVGVITVADVLDAFVSLSGVAEATHRLILAGRSSAQLTKRARRAVEHVRGQIHWLRRDPSPRQLHLRVKVKRIDALVAALEAEGVRVVRVVAAARAR